ncbi:MAG: hypothetical protein KAI66_05920 [Lentisphaeria bacterium]|nr:hypothetical protein [Lentisphaeria bacterium]
MTSHLRNIRRLITGLVASACLLTVGRVSGAPPSQARAEAELAALKARVAAFQVVPFPTIAGDIVLEVGQSLTVAHLRGVSLTALPPVLGQPVKPYDKRMSDGFAPGEAPYVAKDIKPFRFRYFNCEFNYGGWHNYAMADYASAHGFNIVYPYNRSMAEGAHLPKGTQWLHWGGFIDWHKWFDKHGLPDARYDMLTDMDLLKLHTDEKVLARVEPPKTLRQAADLLMIDMEHPVLSPKRLRKQSWYPKDTAKEEQDAFEAKYYKGYSLTYTSAVAAARKQGWRNISIYGWQPYGRTWGGLEKPEVDPGSNHAWNAFGKRIYDTADIIHNSVYCFYWAPRNVAYVLANIDANMALIRSMPNPKPLRPYFWTLLHGGGGGWRWWRGQPLSNEEQRAMITMAFFTGIDGFDSWNWSGTGSHHTPPRLLGKSQDYFSSGADVMLKDSFELTPEGATPGMTPERFRRHDVLHIVEADGKTETLRFQKIRPGTKNNGVTEDQLFFRMPSAKLTPHLRIKSEPVAAMIEGMALAKPLEYILRHGEVKVDVPARRQFKETLPLVRRVKLGDIHILVTYDPGVVHGGEPRKIVLADFAGHAGLTLTLPADDETRIFVIREQR